MGDKQPIPAEQLGITPEDGAKTDVVQELPRELTTPSTPTGERYGRVPTHFQDTGERIFWVVEPETEAVDISRTQEGSIADRSEAMLIAKGDLDDATERITELKPRLKADIEAIPGVAGLYFESLGLKLTNIEQHSASLTDETELRKQLGPEFFDLATQEVGITLKLAKEYTDRTGKPITPEYLTQLVMFALEIAMDNPDAVEEIFSAKAKTTVDKKAAATLWEQGKIVDGDLKFKTTHALTPDSKPRTAPKAKKDDK